MNSLALPTTHAPLIERALADQQSLTAVERFARLHDSAAAEQARHYRDLIPLTAPSPGEQYAFTVDLDACSGCKACVTACHSLNGLDDCETFRDVGALVGRDRGNLHVLQHVTTACHHCLEPACLAGCPTRAYDKDPRTGIVRHLDDQCIGCQYCTLMCPYDVPKYNPAKGIVRKCDMCRQRLADGEAPACVQACPNQAIRIEVVAADNVRQRAERGQFLPHTADPLLTFPTTRFVTARSQLRDIEPPPRPLAPSHAHLPLVVMLVLTQMAAGMFTAASGLLLAGYEVGIIAAAALLVGLTGLVAAVAHLGRPQIAHRAWLGWRTSWMSREIIAFQCWLVAAVAFAALLALGGGRWHWLRHVTGGLTVLTGLVAIYCSAMIYVATGRPFWSARRTLPQFFLTAAVLGIAAAYCTLTRIDSPPQSLIALLMVASLGRLFAASTRASDSSEAFELLSGPLSAWHMAQAAFAMFGGLALPAVILAVPPFAPALAFPTLAFLLAAEFIHRGLFFAACKSPGMPGVEHA